eukprot:338192-Chlamydomonas_euryale.AAC.2
MGDMRSWAAKPHAGLCAVPAQATPPPPRPPSAAPPAPLGTEPLGPRPPAPRPPSYAPGLRSADSAARASAGTSRYNLRRACARSRAEPAATCAAA